MTSDLNRGDDALSKALAPTSECPSIEELAAVAEGLQETADTLRIRTHASGCVRCDSEMKLAQAFFDDEAMPEAREMATELAAAMKKPLDGVRNVSEDPVAKPAPRRTWWLLAAMVLLALALWPIVRSSGVQPLPPPQVDTVVRGSVLDVVAPQGRLTDPPQEFRWSERSDAVTYRVDLLRIDGAVIWSTAVEEGVASLPMSVVESLHRRTRYNWMVIGLDSDGRVVATSPDVGFIIDSELGS